MNRLVDNTIISLNGSNENFPTDHIHAHQELDTTKELLLKNQNTQDKIGNDETIVLAKKATSHKSLYSNGQLSLNNSNIQRSISYCPNEKENNHQNDKEKEEEDEDDEEEVQFEMNNHSDEEILSQSLNRYSSLSNNKRHNSRHNHMNSKSRLRTKSTSSSSYINQAINTNDLTHM
jgi:hypothetical protein